LVLSGFSRSPGYGRCGVLSLQLKTVGRFDSKVLIRLAALHKSTSHSSYKAEEGSLHCCKASKLEQGSFIGLGVRTIVEEVYYAIRGDTLQIRREGMMQTVGEVQGVQEWLWDMSQSGASFA
jgi:hypothetical protein